MTISAARPTTYKGIRMRSRLEATYAQWLDGFCTWEYEPECFADETGQYLPDFLVKMGPHPDDWSYVEVKPTLKAAHHAYRRMEVILSTHPNARLEVVIPAFQWPDIGFMTVAISPGIDSTLTYRGRWDLRMADGSRSFSR